MHRLIDVHAHLYPPNFAGAELSAVLERARAVGVRGIVTVPEMVEECEEVLCWPNLGLHPVQKEIISGSAVRNDVARLQDQIAGVATTRERAARLSDVPPAVEFIQKHKEKLIAVGEVRLDFTPHVIHPGHTASQVWELKKDYAKKETVEAREFEVKEEQKEVFRRVVRCAMDADLPVNCHSRSAGKYTIEILGEELNVPPHRAILHAFDGSNALATVSLGYFLSVPPSVVRSPQNQTLNEPSEIMISLEEVVKRKGVAKEEVEVMMLENTGKVFRDLDTKWLARTNS
ncbi:Metallo-dependent hydrolase [Gonapodya prolifera JEL478]|uniref:Metallo-dependent hydrolase n=1 Tax=Gonapodya prolifera (strain JEL478) TaxID=1344416 RepID=A0A139A664_GONPJ|nr:Metallo-dependent hydrolase [Gonapodya prolifera JEL478]|eukprot:KXS12287.1 Metallo-dependent hydrolase [Gonapodya prolifera JEL478]